MAALMAEVRFGQVETEGRSVLPGYWEGECRRLERNTAVAIVAGQFKRRITGQPPKALADDKKMSRKFIFYFAQAARLWRPTEDGGSARLDGELDDLDASEWLDDRQVRIWAASIDWQQWGDELAERAMIRCADAAVTMKQSEALWAMRVLMFEIREAERLSREWKVMRGAWE